VAPIFSIFSSSVSGVVGIIVKILADAVQLAALVGGLCLLYLGLGETMRIRQGKRMLTTVAVVALALGVLLDDVVPMV
jgi:hypothetical protein